MDTDWFRELPVERLEALGSAGVLVRIGDDYEPASPEVRQALQLFGRVLFSKDLRLAKVVVPGCPVHFCTAIMKLSGEQGRERVFPAGGQGLDAGRAAISCIGELSERLSLCSLGKGDPRVGHLDAGFPDIDLSAVLGFSRLQDAHMVLQSTLSGDQDKGAAMPWNRLSDRRVRVVNMVSRTPAQFPAFGALFHEDALSGLGVPAICSTIGSAVWGDIDGARERALLELVERDAVAQAWYNRLGITRLETGVIGKNIFPDTGDFLQNRARSWSVFVVESDLPVHVAVSFSYEADGSRAAFGSAAGWTLPSAVKGATFEMLQAEISLELMDKAYPQNGGPAADRVPPQLKYARTRSVFQDWPMEGTAGSVGAPSEDVYSCERLLTALERAGITVWEFDATRPDLAVPCIKLFSPDLCSWQPRFGKSRLFDGVVSRGLRSAPATEDEFAARPFPF